MLDALRDQYPAHRLGVVRLRRRPHRPGRAGADPAGLDLRHDRRTGPTAHPALDGSARGPGVPRRPRQLPRGPPDRAHPVARLPRRHGALRRLRGRVGPEHGLRGRAGGAGRVDRSPQALPTAAPLGPHGPTREPGPGRPAARRRVRRRRPRRSWRTCSSTSRQATAEWWCACPGCPRRRRTTSPGSDRSGRRPSADPSPCLRTDRPAGQHVRGDVLASRGYWVPRRQPETVTLVHIHRV